MSARASGWSPRAALLAAAALVSLGGCSGSTADGATSPATARVELTVYAAASLKGVMDAAGAAFEAVNPGVAITVSTDSSAALATQIEQGAPADLLLSADTASPARLAAAGLTAGQPVSFAGNQLVIAIAPENPAGIETPFDLARPGVRIVAAADEVPISQYAAILVSNLASLPGAPPDFGAAYAANILSKELNVRAVLAKIELGEGDAGIVYATDVPSTTVASIPIEPASANVRATYAGAVLRASTNQATATAFLDWLTGPGGQAILASAGFLPP